MTTYFSIKHYTREIIVITIYQWYLGEYQPNFLTEFNDVLIL